MDNIYVFNAKGTNLYKIGVTDDIDKRMIGLQTGCPYPLELMELRSHKDAYSGEARIHERLQAYRTQGEWFKIDNYATLRIEMVQECDGDLLFGKVFYWGEDVLMSPRILKVMEIAGDEAVPLLFKIILSFWCMILPIGKTMKQRDMTDLEVSQRYQVDSDKSSVYAQLAREFLNNEDDDESEEGW